MELPKHIDQKGGNPQTFMSNPTFAGSSLTLKRIMKELILLKNEPHQYVRVFPSEKDFTFWKVLMIGPVDTPYQGGVFTLYVQFPDDYPNHPP